MNSNKSVSVTRSTPGKRYKAVLWPHSGPVIQVMPWAVVNNRETTNVTVSTIVCRCYSKSTARKIVKLLNLSVSKPRT